MTFTRTFLGATCALDGSGSPPSRVSPPPHTHPNTQKHQSFQRPHTRGEAFAQMHLQFTPGGQNQTE